MLSRPVGGKFLADPNPRSPCGSTVLLAKLRKKRHSASGLRTDAWSTVKHRMLLMQRRSCLRHFHIAMPTLENTLNFSFKFVYLKLSSFHKKPIIEEHWA